MTDYVRVPRPWFMFTGCALAIAILCWAQVILVPIACAVLLAFVLAPVVSVLEKWVGRVTAVLGAVSLFCVGLALVAWLVTPEPARPGPGARHGGSRAGWERAPPISRISTRRSATSVDTAKAACSTSCRMRPRRSRS